MRICTWNSQGNPYNNKIKLNILRKLYNDNDVLLIQECGDIMTKLDLPGATIWVGIQAGAGNDRCNLCIISKIGGVEKGLYRKSSTGRPVMHVEIDDINIYTIHATSGNGLSDVMNLFCNVQEPFIIGGDMNCTRQEIISGHGKAHNEAFTNYVYSGSHFRPGNIGELITSDRVTHPGSGVELDFYIASLSLKTYSTRIHPVMGGDHYPVCTVIAKYGLDYANMRRKSVLEYLQL